MEQISQSIPVSFMHNMFDVIKTRMQRVIDLNDDYIGKQLFSKSFQHSTGASLYLYSDGM